MLKNKIIAECRFVISDGREEYLQTIQSVNEYFLGLITPKNLNTGSKDNVTVQFQVNFGELCVALMSNNIPDPERMTVFRFYSTLKFFESKQRKHNKHERN